jgi:hypothetical protein
MGQNEYADEIARQMKQVNNSFYLTLENTSIFSLVPIQLLMQHKQLL